MNVQFVDLHAQYLKHRDELDSAIANVIRESAYIGGSRVRDFEAAFAAASGATHCIGLANGTDAIYIALRMLGIGQGDEVITTALSWIATSETITQAGATPVFVDIDDYFALDASKLEAAITPRTRAVVVVHLYGQPADLQAIREICARRGLRLIEDCAQAHLATCDGIAVGTAGAAGTFSFYPGKNLGAYGDAGALVTNDAAFAQKCRTFANHGALVKHEHTMEGINSRLDGIQAAILSAKLRHLHDWTAHRRRLASLYDEGLRGITGVVTPKVRAGAQHVYHLYVIRATARDELQSYLASVGIATQIHYPRALPFLPAYRHMRATPAQFPNAASAQTEILSLPLYAELPEEALKFVCSQIRKYYSDRQVAA